jgi:hypothetical protein
VELLVSWQTDRWQRSGAERVICTSGALRLPVRDAVASLMTQLSRVVVLLFVSLAHLRPQRGMGALIQQCARCDTTWGQGGVLNITCFSLERSGVLPWRWDSAVDLHHPHERGGLTFHRRGVERKASQAASEHQAYRAEVLDSMGRAH